MNPFQQVNKTDARYTTEYKQTLSPIVKTPHVYPIGAFDIEGVGGPNGFLCGGVQTEKSYDVFYSPKDLIEHLKKRSFVKYRFFAHNLTYDYGILEPWFEESDFPLLLNGRPFKVSVHRQNANTRYLADSLLFAGGLPLATVGDAIKLPKFETPNEVKSFDPNMTAQERVDLLNTTDTLMYLERDVNIVQEYMTLFQSTLNELGGEMKFTLASSAMDLYRRKFQPEEYRTPFQARNEYARHAYYGGRVEPFVYGLSQNVNVYDINSLYPFVMSTKEYPDPNNLIGPVTNPPKSIIFDYEGIADVSIYIPEVHIPMLPYRHNLKLYFPCGLLNGFYTHTELREAVKNGAKLLYVRSSLYSTCTCRPFDSYVRTLYNLRQELKSQSDSREYVVKIMLNSLYGKFGQRSEAGLQELRSILWWLDGHQDIDCEFREIDGKVWVLTNKIIPGQPDYINTLWASYVTSYARLELFKYMREAGTDLIYCDTDSVFIHGELPTSGELGSMKLEHQRVDVEVYGPKAYLIHSQGDVMSVKCKGVPTDQRLEFLLTGEAVFQRPTGLLEAGRLNPNSEGQIYYPSLWRTVVKHEGQKEPKRRLLDPDFDYSQCSLTAPFQVQDLG